MSMVEGRIAKLYLYQELKHLGALNWYNNSTSFYIKFKDNRVGTIRLSNHKGREKYNCRFELISDKGLFNVEELYEIIDKVHMRVLDIKGFNPDNFVIYHEGSYYRTNKIGYINSVRKTGGEILAKKIEMV